VPGTVILTKYLNNLKAPMKTNLRVKIWDSIYISRKIFAKLYIISSSGKHILFRDRVGLPSEDKELRLSFASSCSEPQCLQILTADIIHMIMLTEKNQNNGKVFSTY
jgi:hypothetical protein